MSRAPRIGILTGGGDVPGLNSVIKSVVYRSTDLGYEVIGIRRGWEGLTHPRPGDEPDPTYLRTLDRINTRTIDRTGGTVLHTSRTNPTKMKTKTLPPALQGGAAEPYRIGEDLFDITPYVLENIKSLAPGHAITIIDGRFGIEKFADLKGKRVSTGAPNSATELMAQRMLEAYGLDMNKDLRRERRDRRERDRRDRWVRFREDVGHPRAHGDRS